MDAEKKYLNRLVESKIKRYLNVFGAISIEGPKWCGKTSTAKQFAKSEILFDDEEIYQRALLSFNLLLEEFKGRPLLLDEWNLFPEAWDKVRRLCDEDSGKGNYILTCSTKLDDEEAKQKIKHSGAGRIGKIIMNTMSLYETNDSTGKVSIQDLCEGKFTESLNQPIDLRTLADFIVRGGWPGNLNVDSNDFDILPKSYMENILDVDMNRDKKRNKEKMQTLLGSIARNETTLVSKKTLISDFEETDNRKEMIQSRTTLDEYLDVLNRLHILQYQTAYKENYRSKERLTKNSKIHFVDPSLACAGLGITASQLIREPKVFGYLFEALVEHDLAVYMDYFGGKLSFFHDNVTNLEVDSILEFPDGDYAAVEIKLTERGIPEALETLKAFDQNMMKKPLFKAIVVGDTRMITADKDSGIYIIPFTALRP